MRKGFFLLVLILAAALAAPAGAQYDEGFGQNKIMYNKFAWSIYRSTHFQIYFYPREKESLNKVASMAESAYDTLSRNLNYQVSHPIPLIFYATHAEFEETNTISNFIPEGIGGFTLPSRDRIVIPIDLPDEKVQQLIQHELTHVFEFEILFQGNFIKAYTSSPPQWFMEGLASYEGNDEDNRDRMILRDAVVNDEVPPIAKEGIEGYFAYRFGHAVFDFIAHEWGPDAVRDFVYEWRTLLGSKTGKVIRHAFNISPEEFDIRFRRYLRQRYLKDLVNKGEPIDFGEQFTAREGYPTWDLSPVPFPSGGLVAGITTLTGNADVAIFSARNRDLYKLVSKGYTIRYQYVVAQSVTVAPSAGRMVAVSPDGNYVAVFVRKEHSRQLALFSVLHGGIDRMIRFPVEQAESPSFSPDGKELAFSALSNGQSDIYLYNLGTGELTNLTNDSPFDEAPAFSKDGQWIYYSSISGRYMKIYRLRIDNPSVREQVTFGEWNDEDVSVSPDGSRIFFTSDRDGGIFNIYSLDLKTGETWEHTNVVGGAFTPTAFIGKDGSEQLIFCSYYKRRFGIYISDANKPYKKLAELSPAPTPITEHQMATFTPSIEVALDQDKIEKGASHKLYIDGANITAGLNTDSTVFSNTTLQFSDNLGDRMFVANYQSLASYSNINLTYVNMGHRLQYGASIYDYRLYYYGIDTSTGFLNRGRRFIRETGASILGTYPIDIYHRFDGNIGFISRSLDAPFFLTNEQGSQSVTFNQRRDNDPTAGLSFTGDTTLYTDIGPLEGHRYTIGAQYIPDLRSGNEVVGTDPSGNPIISRHGGTLSLDLTADLRQYLRISRRSLIALRVVGVRSSGNFPTISYFGGYDTLRAYDYASEIGNEIVFGNAEFRFPLIDALALPVGVLTDIRGKIFVDAGAADLTASGQPFRFWNGGNHSITLNGVTYQPHQLVDGLADYGFGVSTQIFGLGFHWDFARQWDLKNSLSGFRTSFYIGAEF